MEVLILRYMEVPKNCEVYGSAYLGEQFFSEMKYCKSKC